MNLSSWQFKKNVTISSIVTKTQLQGLLLLQIKNQVTDQTKVFQLKLQLIEAEKVAREADEQTFDANLI